MELRTPTLAADDTRALRPVPSARVRVTLSPLRGEVEHVDSRGAVRVRSGLLVEARLDGLRGFGEASPLPGVSPDDLGSCETALLALGDELEVVLTPEALGHDARLSRLPPAARMGLESALLDLAARRAGVALAVLLAGDAGGTLANRLDTQVLVPSGSAGDGAIARALASGARALKLKIGAPGEVARDRLRIAEARALGPGLVLRVDVNESGLGPELRASLESARIDLCEDPWTPAEQRHRERARLPFPVALDAAVARDADAALAEAGRGQVAALVLKPTVLGGLLRARAIARRARRLGLQAIVSHTLESPVGMAACAHLALALGGGETHGLGRYGGLERFRVGTSSTCIAIPEWLGLCELRRPSTLGLGVEVGAS